MNEPAPAPAAVSTATEAMARLAVLLEKRRLAKQAIIDARYHDMPEIETDEERDKRIMDTPEAWR